MTTYAVTGHRPDKLGGYDAHENFRAIRRHMRDFLQALPEERPGLISGGALGIDQFWIEVGFHLDLPVTVALPFEGYDAKWPGVSRQEYQKLLDKCTQVLYICEPGYAASKLQTRNEWMVDNCDELAAYWNGAKGGTKNCLDYAGIRGRTVHKFNPDDIIRNAKSFTP